MYVTSKPALVYTGVRDLGGFGEMTDTQHYLLIGGLSIAAIVASIAVQYWWMKVQANLMAEAFHKRGGR